MPRPQVFITQPVPETAVARLRAAADVQMFPDPARIMPHQELVAAVRTCDVLYCLLHDRVDRDVIESGTRLHLIATSAINPTNIDVASATARGIAVTVIPNIVAEATADLQWGLLLTVATIIRPADRALRQGIFPGSQSMHFARVGIHGKTLGTIGLGAIGTAIARRARGFDMRILYTKRQRLAAEQEEELGVSYRTLDNLLRQSDIVTVNATYHPETHHLIGAREIALMKPTAYLINTARGAMLDEAALAEALRAGKIAGAGLDVFENEPNVHPLLKTLDNVVLTPHIGTADKDTREQMASIVVDNILAFLEGNRPPNLHNPQAFEQSK